jgi:hypothetical protein
LTFFRGGDRVLGRVSRIDRESISLKTYALPLDNTVQTDFGRRNTVYSACRKDSARNFLATSTEASRTTTFDEVKLVTLLDMGSTATIGETEYAVINKSKLGTHWWTRITDPRTFQMI